MLTAIILLATKERRIMIQFAEYFTYYNKATNKLDSSKDYDLSTCAFNYNKVGENSGLRRSVEHNEPDSYRQKTNFSKIVYTGQQVISVSLIKNNGCFNDEEIRCINTWLINGVSEDRLTFYNWGGGYDISFYGAFVDVSYQYAGGRICGLTYSFSTNAPYAFCYKVKYSAFDSVLPSSKDIVSGYSDDTSAYTLPVIRIFVPAQETLGLNTNKVILELNDVKYVLNTGMVTTIDLNNSIFTEFNYTAEIKNLLENIYSGIFTRDLNDIKYDYEFYQRVSRYITGYYADESSFDSDKFKHALFDKLLGNGVAETVLPVSDILYNFSFDTDFNGVDTNSARINLGVITAINPNQSISVSLYPENEESIVLDSLSKFIYIVTSYDLPRKSGVFE